MRSLFCVIAVLASLVAAGCSTPHLNYHPPELEKADPSTLCRADINTKYGNINKTHIDGTYISHPFGMTSRSGIIFLKPGNHTITVELSSGHKMHLPNSGKSYVYIGGDGKVYCSSLRKPAPDENIVRGVLTNDGKAATFHVTSGSIARTVEATGFRGWRGVCFPGEGIFWNTYQGTFSCRAGEQFDLLERAESTLLWKQ